MTASDEIGRSSSVVRHSLAEDPLAVHRPARSQPARGRIPESYVPEAALAGPALPAPGRADPRSTLSMSWRRSSPIVSALCRRKCGNLLFVVQIKVLAINIRRGAIGVRGRAVADQMCAPGDAGSERVARTAEEPGRVGPSGATRNLAAEMREGREWREDLATTLGAIRGSTRLSIPRPDLDQIAFRVRDHRRVHAPRLVTRRVDRLRAGRDHPRVHTRSASAEVGRSMASSNVPFSPAG